MRLSPAGQLEVVFVYGDGLSVTGTTGITRNVHRPGYGIGVAGPGAAPSAPFPVPPGLVAQILASLDGRPGGRGGAPTVPTDATIAASRRRPGDLGGYPDEPPVRIARPHAFAPAANQSEYCAARVRGEHDPSHRQPGHRQQRDPPAAARHPDREQPGGPRRSPIMRPCMSQIAPAISISGQ